MDNITTTSPGVRITYLSAQAGEETAKAKLQKLLANSNRAYEEFEKAQKELGEYLCSLMREVIPNISFQLGDYDAGIEHIRFILPEEEKKERWRLYFREENEEEREERFPLLCCLLSDIFQELGIEEGEHIWFGSGFCVNPEEVKAIKQLLREKLGGDK